jgi:hypothetical protein
LKLMESHLRQFQQSHVNLAIPHLLPKELESSNLKSMEFHPSQFQQPRVNLVTPHCSPL